MSNWEEYEEYRYPRRERKTIGAPRVSGDTIVRTSKRRVKRRGRKGLPCYCLDRCHHLDISITPMFRPFAWDLELDDYRLDLEPKIDSYQIEIVKSDERIVRGANSIRRYSTTEASSFRKNGHTYFRLKHGDEYQIKMIMFTF